jgi:hypothetical protein
MKRSVSFAGSIRRCRRRSTDAAFKTGTLALVVFMVAMAFVPLAADSAFAANDDDDDDKIETQQVVHVDPAATSLALTDDPVVDPSPEPTETPLVFQAVDPEDAPADDDPQVKLPEENPPPDVTPVYIAVSIYINKLECPLGFDAYNADYNELAASCQEGMNGIPFALQTPNEGLGQNTGWYQDHMIVWEGVAGGDEQISEMIPDGYTSPIVMCSFYDSDFFQVYAAGGNISVNTGEGDYLYCDWYNVPDDGNVMIYINKLGCPDGFDAYEADQNALAFTCLDQMNGVQFTLDNINGQTSQNTGDITDHMIAFENGGAGDQKVTETLPDGYGLPVVFCNDNQGPFHPMPVDENGPSISFSVDDDHVFYCDWFNVPDNKNGTVDILKFKCPSGTELYNDDKDYYFDQCTDAMDGVAFTLSDGVNPDKTGTTGDAGPGTIHWDDIPAGLAQITESIPDGYFDPVVYCEFTHKIAKDGGFQFEDGFVHLDVANDGVLSHDFDERETLTCWWFNVPRGNTEITIYKYTCPEGYDVHEIGANPENDCPDLTDGVAFTLEHDHDGVIHWKQTGDSIPGAVHWSGLDEGNQHITEGLPDGTVAIVVNCTTTTPDGLPSKFALTPDVSDPSIDLDVVKGQVIVCHWFNDPKEEPHGGQMKVVKYWCDGVVYTVEACDIYEGGASFAVGAASGEGALIFGTTGDDGTWTLNLPAGAYTIDEHPGEWCYATATMTDLEGNVVVNDGETTEVDVFNCGPKDEGKKSPIKKFPNTGIDPAAMFFPPLFA